MKPLAALAAVLIAAGATVLPAVARDSYVIDNAHLLSPTAISQINAKVADFNAQTHKEVVVDTEPTVNGSPQAAAEQIFAQQQINGVLIYVAKSPKTIGVIPDRAAARFFPPGSTSAIRDAIRNAFNSGDYDGGITNGVDLTLSEYRSHLGALSTSRAPVPYGGTVRTQQTGGFSMGWILWLIVLLVIFMIVRGIFRAMAGPRMMPPGGGYGGPGYGGGYGPGYGGGFGGGGGFWSGMLGGLGGAFLGNELFGNRGGGGFIGGGDPNQAGFGGGAAPPDASGWQGDAGQADMGNASFGGWGDGGGGGGGGGGDAGGGWGGGGDFGGGGGGDSGGGGW